MWTQSLPWHKVLNAVVAELGIHKFNDSQSNERVFSGETHSNRESMRHL